MTQRSIGANGGSVEVTEESQSLYGAKIDVPSNALSETTLLSIQSSPDSPPVPTDTTAAGPPVRFLPDGTVFSQAVVLSLPYNDIDNDGIIDGTTISETDIAAVVFNPESRKWQDVSLEGLDTENNILTLKTTHFTDYEAITYLTNTCKTSGTTIDIGPFYFTLYFDFRSQPNIYKASVSDVGADLNVGNATILDSSTAVVAKEGFQDMFDQIVDAGYWDWSWSIVPELTDLTTKTGLTDAEVVFNISTVSPKSLQFEWNFDYHKMAPFEMLVVQFTGSTDTVCTLMDRTPTPPDGLQVSQTSAGGIKLTWNAVTDIYDDVAYSLYISEDNGATFQLRSTHTTTNGTAGGLLPETGYQFRVTTVYGNGLESDFSNTVTGTTDAANQPPISPTSLTAASVTSNSFQLSWNAATDADGSVAGYSVFISSNGQTDSLYATVTTTTITVTGLLPDTTYFFTVSATDNLGETSDKSSTLSVTTLQSTP